MEMKTTPVNDWLRTVGDAEAAHDITVSGGLLARSGSERVGFTGGLFGRTAELAAVGKAVELRRRERGLTPEALAREGHVTPEMLDDLERGVRVPNSAAVIRLVSKVLDLPADKLITAGGLGDTADPALQTAAVRFVSRMQQVPEHLSPPEREALTEFIGTLAAK